MIDIGINESTGDIELDNGDLSLVDDIDAVVQYLRAKLKTFQGEWFLDQSIGIPYFKEIFKKNFNPVAVDSIFKNAILNTPNIIELQSFEMDVTPNRTLDIRFRVKTKYGGASLSEVIP